MRYNEKRVQELLKQPRGEENVEELLVLNYGLLVTQLRKFYMYFNPDALSLGYEALYKAVMTYDYTTNNKFSTYATVCIYNSLASYLRDQKNKIVEISYDVPVDGYTLLDILESGERTDAGMDKHLTATTLERAIILALKEMTNPLHAAITELWVQSEFEMTHVKIAEVNGCTQSYVSQVIKKFRKTIKSKLGELENETSI